MLPFEFIADDITYTKAERKIIDYIYQNLTSILFISIGQLSKQLEVSEATISRFAKHAGYQDFKDLKAAIAKHLGQESPAEKMAETLAQSNASQMESLLRKQQSFLEKTMENIDNNEINRAVDAMIGANHIFLYGKGASKGLATLLEFRVNRFGKPVTILPPGGSEMLEKLIHVHKNDLVIIFGFQKIPKEAQVILKQGKIAGYQTILFTSRLFDTDEKRGDINLFVYRGESKEYHSMSVPMALIDGLVVMIAGKLGQDAVECLSSLHQLKQTYSEDIPR